MYEGVECSCRYKCVHVKPQLPDTMPYFLFFIWIEAVTLRSSCMLFAYWAVSQALFSQLKKTMQPK